MLQHIIAIDPQVSGLYGVMSFVGSGGLINYTESLQPCADLLR